MGVGTPYSTAVHHGITADITLPFHAPHLGNHSLADFANHPTSGDTGREPFAPQSSYHRGGLIK